jgi:hypothetical protein
LTPEGSKNVTSYPPVGFRKTLSADRAGVNQRLVTRITLATPKAVIPDSITITGNIISHLQANPRIDRSANESRWVYAEYRIATTEVKLKEKCNKPVKNR